MKLRYSITRALQFTLLSGGIVLLLSAPSVTAQKTQSAKPESSTLRGTVRDGAGKPVGGAHVVLLEPSSRTSRDTVTDARGAFAFAGAGMGSFTLTASSGTMRSPTVSLTVSTPGEQVPFNLVLSTSGAQPSTAAPGDATQAMQFADNPDFAIAAVTDWTAAGGHGSDASLRASEALTREAVKLGPKDAQPAGSASHAKESESALRDAVDKDPNGFEPNHNLGLFYLQSSQYADAVRFLKAAYETDPAKDENEYELAQALRMNGDAAEARTHVQRLLARRQTGDLDRMLGELDEKLGDPLSAVRDFQQAAGEDPSEDNYFAWGSELLLHRAVWQAKEVFDEGARRYPHSVRMLTARGAALFAGALYDQAALDLCTASDLNPENLEPYLFMGKIEIVAPDPLPCVVAKLARFETLHPTNPLADYYYAMALWKQQGRAADSSIMPRVEDLLNKAVTLDPKCADAHLQLGNLSSGRKEWEQAIGYYRAAIEADPELNEAHYRLGVAYERAGEQAKAKEQFQLHDTIARQQAAEIQRQRQAVKQFLVVIPGAKDTQQAR